MVTPRPSRSSRSSCCDTSFSGEKKPRQSRTIHRFRSGNRVNAPHNIRRVSTSTANGKSLSSLADFTRFFDASQPLLVNDAGLIESVEIPGEGAVFLQAGKLITVDSSGQPTIVYVDAGPDQLVTVHVCSFRS